MKRSEVNDIIRAADAFIRSFGFILPPFAYWSPQTMLDRRAEIDGIVDARLGWDITDYGAGPVRHARAVPLHRAQRLGGGPPPRRRHVLRREDHDLAPDQVSPMHRHIVKAEDIINRGGATLALRSTRATPRGTSTTTPR